MKEEANKHSNSGVPRALIVLAISVGIHMLSVYSYASLHWFGDRRVMTIVELILCVSLLALWVGYGPHRKLWVRAASSLVALILHWALMPCY